MREENLRPLWQALWDRLSSGHPVSSVRLRGLDDPQRSALADLLGLARLPPPEVTVSIKALESVGIDPRAVVETVIGPLDDRAARRAAERTARDEFKTWLAAHPVIRAEPALTEWATSVRTDQQTLRTALAVLEALPSDGRPLSAFAGQVCGDTHALDDGTRLSTVVLKALAAIHDEPPPTDAGERRACWDRAGIACDALSTTVLTAGLRPTGDDPLSSTVNRWSEAGQAVVITLAQLAEFGPLTVDTPTLWVVENPSILAMAVRRFGRDCPPLVTTSGWPNSAVMLLLRQTNAEIRYHGDFDGEGLRIAAHVLARTGAVPWRMSTDDYLAGVRPGRPHPGRISDAPWDPALSTALREHGVTVSEEHVAEALLADLAITPPATPSPASVWRGTA
jgi:uncharacterized protein (TIGR02679 family)